MRIRSLVPALGIVLLAAACAPPGGTSTTTDSGSKTAPKSTLDAAKIDHPTGKLDVAVFEGGYKLDFYEQTGIELADKTGIESKVWGDPRVWEQLKPKFLAGDVPDVTWPGWGMDYWKLVYGGQVYDMNEALDLPAYGQTTGKWRDTFEPGLLKLGEYEGHQYLLPHHVNVNGWWYSPKLFAQNKWEVPKNYEELLALCVKIKAKGIAPITFQGKYPYYMDNGFLYPWVVSKGGIQALDDCFNLVPGAWKSEAVIGAAKMIDELRTKGYFEKGALGLSHTESQADFLNHKAAFITCGTWLYSEMKDVMPPGADMAFLPTPVPADAKDPSAIQAGIEPWIVPAQGKNKEAGIAYYRYLTSLEKSKQFVKEKGTLTAIKGSSDVELPEHLKGAAAALKESKAIWSADFALWYPAFDKEIQNGMAALLAGDITPEQFADRCEAAAETTRKDDSLPKHKVAR